MILRPQEFNFFLNYFQFLLRLAKIFRKIRIFEKFPGKLKKFPGSLGYPDYPLLKGKVLRPKLWHFQGL